MEVCQNGYHSSSRRPEDWVGMERILNLAGSGIGSSFSLD